MKKSLFSAILFLTLSHSVHADWRTEIVSELKPGDIVFRRGLKSDLLTKMILNQSPDSKYSHIGIVVSLSQNSIYIVDSMPNRGVGFVTPKDFFSEGMAETGTYKRLNNATEANDLAVAATKHLGKSFDYAFKLENSDSLYCTELAYLALKDIKHTIEPREILGQQIFYPDDFLSVH